MNVERLNILRESTKQLKIGFFNYVSYAIGESYPQSRI